MRVTWLSQSEADVPDVDHWLTARERARAAAMRYAKRRNDFLLGRWTAKRAVTRWLGLPGEVGALARVEIENASDGSPRVLIGEEPAPVEISMTDRAGWAVCVLRSRGAAIGCDLEIVEPRSPAFVADYFTPAEQATVRAGATEADRHLRANLLWSAKESALKVLRTGLRRDTRSVEVSLGVCAEADAWHPLCVTAEEGIRFPGWWRRYGAFLLTVAAEVEMAPPASLDSPPAIASGVPTESWRAGPLLRR